MGDVPADDLALREQLVKIDQLIADATRKRQEFAYEPRRFRLMVVTTCATAAGATAAVFLAGVAVGQFFLGVGT